MYTFYLLFNWFLFDKFTKHTHRLELKTADLKCCHFYFIIYTIYPLLLILTIALPWAFICLQNIAIVTGIAPLPTGFPPSGLFFSLPLFLISKSYWVSSLLIRFIDSPVIFSLDSLWFHNTDWYSIVFWCSLNALIFWTFLLIVTNIFNYRCY